MKRNRGQQSSERNLDHNAPSKTPRSFRFGSESNHTASQHSGGSDVRIRNGAEREAKTPRGQQLSDGRDGPRAMPDQGRGSKVKRHAEQHASQALQPGTQAPDFELNTTPDQKVDLNHFRGRPVVLVFYPADWSPVCGDQLALYNEILSEFDRHAAQLLGISVDSSWCHGAYAQSRRLHFPLLADFEPKGEVSRMYRVYREGDGVCERALFVIDGEGTIRWSYVSPLGVNPGASGILKALESITQDQKETAYV